MSGDCREIVGSLRSIDETRGAFLNDLLKKIQAHNENPFLNLAVIGEFSSGKSTFINGYLGMPLLKTASMATTAVPTHIHRVQGIAEPNIEAMAADGTKYPLGSPELRARFTKQFDLPATEDVTAFLKTQGCERIYEEKMTGTKASRPVLDSMLAALRAGDTLVIESFSRLSRSTRDLLEVVERLKGMGVNLVSLKEQLDTTTATGKMMLTVLYALSQFERDIIAERTVEGLKAAKARGRQGGRPKAPQKAVEMALKLYDADTMSVRQISEATGVSTATINRRVAERKATSTLN